MRAKTLSRVANRGLAYAKFKAHKFSYLNISGIGSSYVPDGVECGLACVSIPLCLSLNLAAFHDIIGKLPCEVLPWDMYNNSDKFVASTVTITFVSQQVKNLNVVYNFNNVWIKQKWDRKCKKEVSKFYFHKVLGNLLFDWSTIPIPAVKKLHEMTWPPINLPIDVCGIFLNMSLRAGTFNSSKGLLLHLPNLVNYWISL